MREYELFIDGKHVSASRSLTATTHDPITGAVVSVVARASDRDARRAAEAARHAADDVGWSELAAGERAARLRGALDLLFERQAEIADLDVAEAGVPIRIAYELAAGALADARDRIATSASIRGVEPDASSSALMLRRPHGVAAIAPASDAPFARTIGAVIPALLAGNTVVLRPSAAACSSAMEVAVAFHESDVPPGVLNVLSGAGREVDDELAENVNVDLLAYAGRAAELRRVGERAARASKPAMLDVAVGGTAIVLADADLDATIAGVAWGAFVLAGRAWRRCARIIVHRSIAEPVAYHLGRVARGLRVGPPASFDTDLGPQASLSDAEACRRALTRAIDAGAVPVALPAAAPDPAYAMPAVVRASVDSAAAWDEIPGPVITIVETDSETDMVAIANRPPSRTSASVWSRDLARAVSIARRLTAETVWINEHIAVRGAGDGIVLDDGFDFDRRTRIAPGRRGTVRDRPWMATLGLDRIFGAQDPGRR